MIDSKLLTATFPKSKVHNKKFPLARIGITSWAFFAFGVSPFDTISRLTGSKPRRPRVSPEKRPDISKRTPVPASTKGSTILPHHEQPAVKKMFSNIKNPNTLFE